MVRLILRLILLLVVTGLSAESIPLQGVLDQLKATLQWNPETETGYLDLSGEGLGELGDRIIFSLGSPWMVVNYREKIRTQGVQRSEGNLLFPDETLEVINRYFELLALRRIQPRVAAVLIDPGHGGKDSGAIGNHQSKDGELNLLEKDLVLDVSKRLYQLLKKEYPEKQILLTRHDDTYLKLEERTEIANNVNVGKHEAIIFVSIHANAAFNKGAKGYEVWVLPGDYRRNLIDTEELDEETRPIAPILNVLLEEEYSIESITLAKAVLEGFDSTVGDVTDNRGIREESWFVVRKAKMPSILIELGYVTNREEAYLLADESYLQKLTSGIYTGIRSFVANFESTKGFTE
ncbi:MAG: N-acetylmuramoyl-L-alanine amidase [Spirochaetaceae bacterium]|nr:MAG: N-acetylmuramoyl-L-alanine amidase [Spirochaetaceae bacterium]